jgi:uncharacterized protein (TIGR02444 family)
MAEAGFWEFSLDFYGRAGVAEACIALQDRRGCDVNMILYCCWIGLSGRGRLDRAALAAAEAAVAPWRRGVVEPLRAARRAIKAAGPAELYQDALAVELAAEKAAQAKLAALAPPPAAGSDRLAAATANLLLYLGAAGEDTRPILAALATPPAS